MQRAAIVSSAASLATPDFSTLAHKRHDSQKKVSEHKIFILILCTDLFKTFQILRRNQRDIVINVETCSCEVPVILAGF
jgi:hypothetical protein